VEVSQIPTYAQIVESAAPALLRLAVMLTGSHEDAEDLLQATVLRTHRHAGRLEAMAAPVAYLRRVMVNEHISSGRRRARRVRTMPFPPHFEPRWTDRDVARADERGRIWRLLPLLRAHLTDNPEVTP
jgi:DNA-directed RNA polymerase specialized sigma24 family protein